MKKLLASLLFLFSLDACTPVAAEKVPLKSYYDLFSSIQYSDQQIRAFDSLVDPYKGGGYFQWIRVTSNASIPNIPGIQAKPRRNTKGYWRRQYSGPVYSDFIGGSNSITQKTWAQYGYSQAKIDSLFNQFLGDGFISVNDHPDETALRAGHRLMETKGYQDFHWTANEFYAWRSIEFPRIVKNATLSDKQQFNISPNGSVLILMTNGIVGLDRYPANQAAADVLLCAQFFIGNVTIFANTGITGTTGIRLTCTQNSMMTGIVTKKNSVGAIYSFCLHGYSILGESSQCDSAGMIINRGDWPGADATNSQSNIFHVFGHRDFGNHGIYGIYTAECSNVTLDDINVEGDGGRWAIYVDNKGSGLMKEVVINNIYGESHYDSAVVFLRGNDVTYTINRFFVRQAETDTRILNCVYFKGSACAYPQLVLNDFPYWQPSYMRFVNVWGSCSPDPGATKPAWQITNLNHGDCNSAANFVNPAKNFFNLTVPGSSIPDVSLVTVVKKNAF